MNTTEPTIDLTLLEKVHRSGEKLTARCPACAATGGDRSGVHFFLNTATGQWGCGALPGDTEHRREIFALVGIRSERTTNPERDRQFRENRRRERQEAEVRSILIQRARERRAAIMERWHWDSADIWDDSPQRIDQPLIELDPRHFLASLFPPDVVLWTGEVYHSGTRYADRWRTVADWQNTPELFVGPMVSPATWLTGTISRAAANVATAPFIVLDFDGFDRIKPRTRQEINRNVQDALGLVCWFHQGLEWKLAAIVWTGSKSIHAWFHSPPADVVQSLATTAAALGIDAGLIGRPEHPCRLPGHPHQKTGQLSRVLWLQNPV